jgi:hypothetical protein
MAPTDPHGSTLEVWLHTPTTRSSKADPSQGLTAGPGSRAWGGEGWVPAAGTRAHERHGHPKLHSSLDGK